MAALLTPTSFGKELTGRTLLLPSLSSSSPIKLSIPVAVAMVYCTHSVFKQSFSSVENNNSF
jgi:hypothetical protein